jgi:hypothetical protein
MPIRIVQPFSRRKWRTAIIGTQAWRVNEKFVQRVILQLATLQDHKRYQAQIVGAIRTSDVIMQDNHQSPLAQDVVILLRVIVVWGAGLYCCSPCVDDPSPGVYTQFEARRHLSIYL